LPILSDSIIAWAANKLELDPNPTGASMALIVKQLNNGKIQKTKKKIQKQNKN